MPAVCLVIVMAWVSEVSPQALVLRAQGLLGVAEQLHGLHEGGGGGNGDAVPDLPPT